MFRLLPVQILLASVGMVNGIVSSLFASNFVGVKAMGAVGLYSPVNLAVVAITIMLVGGATIICGEHIGRNDPVGVQNIFALDIVLSGILAIIVTVAHLIFGLVGSFITIADDPEINRMLASYVLGQAISIIPLFLGSQLSAFLSLDNKGKRATIASIVYIVVNFILNFLFVGVLRLEALGLALAPSIGLWIYFLIQAPCFMSKDAPMRFSFKGLNWSDSWKIVRVGMPGAAGNAYHAVRGIVVNSLIIASIGAIGISASTAANSLLSLFWIIPDGMLVVSRMMISVSVGEEDRQSLIDVMKTALYNFIPILLVLSFAIMLMAEPLTRLYYRDPSDPVYMMTLMGFRILPLCMPLSIIMTHFSCYWQASDRHIPVHILALLDGVVGTVVFTMLLIGNMGMTGVYLANVLNGLIAPVFVLIYASINKKGFPKNLDELMA
ncbi:MAG: polysaccharide biosynthesis C-terminal domain-containing protein, partial [Lachnospiraceae bacterium]|nr:polysaccharide biosynthesis C-terminal domain-containing protein [Lachnospiraceae bacterium]